MIYESNLGSKNMRKKRKKMRKREYQQQILIYIWMLFEMVELGNNKMSSFMRHRQKNRKVHSTKV